MFTVHVKTTTPEGQTEYRSRDYYEKFDAVTVANIEKRNALIPTNAVEFSTNDQMMFHIKQFGGGTVEVWVVDAAGCIIPVIR